MFSSLIQSDEIKDFTNRMSNEVVDLLMSRAEQSGVFGDEALCLCPRVLLQV